jgi:hypothetical protein
MKKPRKQKSRPRFLQGLLTRINLTASGTAIRGGQSDIQALSTVTVDDSKVTVIKALERSNDTR